jgi:hypothetical protein
MRVRPSCKRSSGRSAVPVVKYTLRAAISISADPAPTMARNATYFSKMSAERSGVKTTSPT